MTAKLRLMVPGPTPLPPRVQAAATVPLADERTPEFAGLFLRVLNNLATVFGTTNDVLLFTSSMTGAFEGAVTNLFSPGERVLVVTNGMFGERWVHMGRAFGLDVVELSFPWGRPIDADVVATRLAADPLITAAIGVHSETSTGVVNDMAAFGRATAGVLTIVDSASGVGGCALRTDEWGLDVVVAGGQKALMTPPGIAFVTVGQRAWERHAAAGLPRYYFDWTRTRDALRSDVPRTPFTPAVGLLVQLDAALTELLDEGVDAVLERHRRLGRIARAGVRGMGLDRFPADADTNAVVTTAVVPDGIDAEQVVRDMFVEHGVQVVGSGGALAGRVIRIGHCGYVDALDVVAALAALEAVLHRHGADVRLGAGVEAAVAELAGGGAERAERTLVTAGRAVR